MKHPTFDCHAVTTHIALSFMHQSVVTETTKAMHQKLPEISFYSGTDLPCCLTAVHPEMFCGHIQLCYVGVAGMIPE